MSITLWNAIITVGISVTSLMMASTSCMYYYTLYMYCMCTCYQAMHERCTCTLYEMSKGAGQASKMKAKKERWLRNMPWAGQDASANIKSSWDKSAKISQLW